VSCIVHILTKYGIAIRAIPNVTSRIVLDTKYGKIIKASPVTNGTTLFCLLPYTKKPSPIEPKSKPQRRDDVSNTVLKPLMLTLRRAE
jgi:hypothetical protein